MLRAVGLRERTGVLVLRIWVEQGDGGLRARITTSDDVESPEHTSVVAATLDEILRVVREFVERFRGSEEVG